MDQDRVRELLSEAGYLSGDVSDYIRDREQDEGEDFWEKFDPSRPETLEDDIEKWFDEL